MVHFLPQTENGSGMQEQQEISDAARESICWPTLRTNMPRPYVLFLPRALPSDKALPFRIALSANVPVVLLGNTRDTNETVQVTGQSKPWKPVDRGLILTAPFVFLCVARKKAPKIDHSGDLLFIDSSNGTKNGRTKVCSPVYPISLRVSMNQRTAEGTVKGLAMSKRSSGTAIQTACLE